MISSIVDLFSDLSHGANNSHLIKEALVVLLAIISLLWIFRSMRRQTLKLSALKQELKNSKNPPHPAEEYVLSARQRLSEVIARQFNDWKMTSSEKEIGMLLLKGLSLKEIAAIRNTLEKTVRQQASTIYRKANVSGRHAFAAWFIEDFL
ncbi:MAG: LuxR C-terminal-related transcriptional regulator [gamma proteobacterium symbiont of Bathyaustriella thionipta]|nr:LuxR C-terminal-related transcriptional regulator [gamma proteobacterium symbiont of Bathyaustriella thionipta]